MPADSTRLPPAASCPQDCLVGPTESELCDPSSFLFWGHKKGEQRKKGAEGENGYPSKRRKHHDNDGRGDDNGDGECHDQTAVKPTTRSHNNKNKKNSFQKAIDTFLSSGCCYFEKPVLPPHFVETCLDRAKTDYTFLKGLMEEERQRLLNHDGGGGDDDDDDANTSSNSNEHHNRHHRMVALTRQDYAEWVARDGGRVDIRYGLNRYPYNCGGLIYNSIVFPLVQALLNGDSQNDSAEPVQLLYAGVMWGMPVGNDHENDHSSAGNLHQKWHADGGHLFSPHQLPDGLTLPPHCINVFYPLVDLTNDNGPTEFRIASHRSGRETASNERKVEFPITCPAGSAVLFDYRIQHRGRANLLPATATVCPGDADIDRARPVLYLAYAKTYFKDHGNTRSGRKLVPKGTDSFWTTRTLEGRPVPYGKGFKNYAGSGSNRVNDQKTEDRNDNDANNNDDNANNDAIENPEGNVSAAAAVGAATTTTTTTTTQATNSEGVGERWILFQMTLELPNDASEVLKVYRGDVAVEVAQQFCLQHDLQDEFVTVLAQTIQGQIDSCS